MKSQYTVRDAEVSDKARKYTKLQGCSEQTVEAFADFAVCHCPEIQSYGNLFDYYMSKQD
jgi:hypothetical protein